MAQHKIGGVLSSLNTFVFDLNIHNRRVASLLKEMKQMGENSQDIVCSSIANYSENQIVEDAETAVQPQDMEVFVARFKQANSNLRAEMQKLQDNDDVIDGLFHIVTQMIGRLKQQNARYSGKDDADATISAHLDEGLKGN